MGETHPAPESVSDRELRLECARLVMAFGSGDRDPAEAAERLYRYIRDGGEG